MHVEAQKSSRFAPMVSLVLLVLLALPAAAKEKREPIEKFRVNAVSVDRGRASTFDITIYEWTTPEERAGLVKALVEEDSKALYDALGEVSDKGYLKPARTLGYDMQYAWQVEVDGKRRIVLASNRPMGFLRPARSASYSISLVMLELDPETGEGEGQAVGGAEVSIDEETGRLQIAAPGTQPTRLINVKTLPIKKKD